MPGKTEAIAADLRVSAKTRLENCRVPCETEAIAGDPRVSAKTMLKSAAACLAKQRVSRVSHISIGRRRRTRIPRLSMPANTRHGGSFHTGQDAASRASALSTREPGASESGACYTQQPDARMQRSWLAGGAAVPATEHAPLASRTLQRLVEGLHLGEVEHGEALGLLEGQRRGLGQQLLVEDAAKGKHRQAPVLDLAFPRVSPCLVCCPPVTCANPLRTDVYTPAKPVWESS